MTHARTRAAIAALALGLALSAAPGALPAAAGPPETGPEDFACAAESWVAGTSVLCAGVLTYRDYVYDDYGADHGTQGTSTGTLNYPAGDDRYPADKLPNTADLVDLSLRIDGDELEVLFELNALYEPDSTVAALAIDSDGDAGTGGGEWGDLGVRSGGWDVLATFDQGDPGSNLIAGRMPLPDGDRWRLQAVVAVAGGPVMNVAFRGPDEQARYAAVHLATRNPSVGAWFEDRQAAALATGDISEFGLGVDVGDLRSGATRELTEVEPGLHERVYTSSVTLPPGEGMSYTPIRGRGNGGTVSSFSQNFAYFGRYQPYGFYLPSGPAPHGLQMNYHGSNQGIVAQTNQPGFQTQIGEAHNRIIATPLARGPHGYGSDISERDLLDVQADVIANYDVDVDRVYASGYSQGGYITYRQSALYPDRFAAFSSWVGFTGDVANPAPPPVEDNVMAGAVGNMLDFVGNYRHVPGAMIYGDADELVHASSANAMGNEFRRRDFPYIFYQHPTGDHFAFALLDDWAKETDYTARFQRVSRPARVTYRSAEVLGNADYGLRHDRAYWVSQIRGRETVTDFRGAEDAYIDVDALTFGCGGTVPTVRQSPSAGPSPLPWVADAHEISGETALEQANAFEATLHNVASLAINVEDACLTPAPVAYTVTTDGPTELRLSDGRSVAFDEAGTHEGTIAEAAPSDRVERIAGADRIATAVAVSEAAFEQAETVVLARADAYADALAGAPLAAAHDGPLLLTGSPRLDERVAAELDRLGAARVLLLGGDGALSPKVTDDLADAGIAVERIAGATRFDTAAAIARALGETAADVYVVEGLDADAARGWPDAVSAAALAARQGRPVLLAESDRIPQATLDAMAELGTTRATVVGGAAAVAHRAATALTDPDSDGVGQVALHRIAGATRYETAAAVADRTLATGATTRTVWVATGTDWPDALAAGPAVAATDGVLLLVDGADPDGSGAAADWLRAHRPVERVRVVGGKGAISARVGEALRLLVP
jgi:putative cell wall-binding protein